MALRTRGEHGAVAVEFALVFPLLAALLLGMVDLGFALNAKIAMTSAAREGVRAVALGGTPRPPRAAWPTRSATNGQISAPRSTSRPAPRGTRAEATVVLTGSVGTVLRRWTTSR